MPARYQIGCAGQFAIGIGTRESNDADEAIVACLNGPPGCEVYDTLERKWIGPGSMEEIEEARARLDAKRAA